MCCWTPTRFGAGETPSLSSHRAQPLVDEVSYTRIARYPVQTQPPVAAVVYEPPPIEVAATIIPVSTYSPLEGPDDTSKLSIGDAQMIPERLRQWFVDKIDNALRSRRQVTSAQEVKECGFKTVEEKPPSN